MGTKLTLTIQIKKPTEKKPYRSGRLLTFGESYVWTDDHYLYVSCFGPCERKDETNFKFKPEAAWYLSDIEWFKVEPSCESANKENDDWDFDFDEIDTHDLDMPFEGTASPLQLLKNFCAAHSMAWNKRTQNWVKVQQGLLYGTNHDGCTSSITMCDWLGIDPFGHTFDGAREYR